MLLAYIRDASQIINDAKVGRAGGTGNREET
jgi:hypothetical protein